MAASAVFLSLAPMITEQLREARYLTVYAPIPEFPPVTTAYFSERSIFRCWQVPPPMYFLQRKSTRMTAATEARHVEVRHEAVGAAVIVTVSIVDILQILTEIDMDNQKYSSTINFIYEEMSRRLDQSEHQICIFGKNVFRFDIQMILIILIVVAAVAQLPDLHSLQAEITNSQALIQLYQQKLILLQQLHETNYPDLPLPTPPNALSQTISIRRLSEHLILLKRIPSSLTFLPSWHILTNNKIIKTEDYSEIGQFMGDILTVEENTITTLVGGKLSMTVITSDGDNRQKQIFLGQKAEQMSSVWQRNFNIKDGQDILIQWESDQLYLRSTQTKLIEFKHPILSVFPVNQYKVVVVTTSGITLLNTRSQQPSNLIPAGNITRIPHYEQQAEIIAACRDGNIFWLVLSSGELAKYNNQRVISVQKLSNLKGQMPLLPFHTSLHIIGQKLFVVDQLRKQLKIYTRSADLFLFVVLVNLPEHQSDVNSKKYELFKIRESFRLIESSQQGSSIYEVLLPYREETQSNFHIFKIVGILAVILVFIYFKIFRKPAAATGQMERGPIGSQKKMKYSREVEEYLMMQIGKEKKN